MVDAQDSKIVIDLVAAFNSEDDGDLFRCGNALNVSHCPGQFNLRRVLIKDALCSIAQIERAAHGLRSFVVDGDPQCEERYVDAALAQAGNIDVSIRKAL